MIGFAAGVSTLILGLAYGTRGAIGRYNATLRRVAQRTQPVLGAADDGPGGWHAVYRRAG